MLQEGQMERCVSLQPKYSKGSVLGRGKEGCWVGARRWGIGWSGEHCARGADGGVFAPWELPWGVVQGGAGRTVEGCELDLSTCPI